MPTRALVVFYSMTGNSRRLAQEIAADLGAALEEIREPRGRRGFAGVIRALLDVFLKREARIEPPASALDGFDVLVVGGPIWGGDLAAPVKAFLREFAGGRQRLALFCTQGGRGADAAFARVGRRVPGGLLATLAVDAQHLEPPAHRLELQGFVAAIAAGHAASAPGTTPAARQPGPAAGAPD